METFKNIAFHIMMGLTFLGVIIIYASFRGQVHWFIFLPGVGLVIIPGGLLYLYDWYDSRPRSGKERPRMLSELKTTGREIKVDLTRCKIKSNSWTVVKERNRGGYKDQAITALIDPELNVQHVRFESSIVEYSTTVDGRRRIFRSPPISRDKQTLHFLLEVQKETSIYIDRDMPRYYYFDLEFLTQ